MEFEFAAFFRLGDRPAATPWSLSDISGMMNVYINGNPSNMDSANSRGMFGFVSPAVLGLDGSNVTEKYRPYAHNPFEVLVWRMYWAVGDYSNIPSNALTATVNIGGTDYQYYIDYTYRGQIPMFIYLNASPYGGGDERVNLIADAMNTEPEATGHGGHSAGTLAGGAQFDLSCYAKTYFKRMFKIAGPSGGNEVDCTDSVLLPVSIVNMIGNNGGFFRFQNAVAQLQERAEGEWIGAELLTRNTELMGWGAANACPEVTVLVWKEEGQYIYVARRIGIANEGNTDIVNYLIGQNIVKYVGTCKGICVKWVNDLGGVDQFVFPDTYRIERKCKTSGTYKPLQDDTLLMHSNRLAYEISESRVMHLGADNISEIAYRALLWLPYSKQITYYDNDLGKWLECTVEDYSVTEKNDVPQKSFEIKLRLNDINTQF